MGAGERAGRTVRVEIGDLGQAGEGVGRAAGRVVFVPGALPGETVEAEIVERKRRWSRGKLVRVIEPSPQRTAPLCPAYEACGGCQLQHLAIGAQLEWKRRRVEEALRRVGGLRAEVNPVLAAPATYGYRNKSSFPVRDGAEGPTLGFFSRGTHRIVPAAFCPVQHPAGQRAAEAVQAALRKAGLRGYDEGRHDGDVRHVLVRSAWHRSETLITFVTLRREVAGLKDLARSLSAALPDLVGVTQNVQPERSNTILGEENRTLSGRPHLLEQVLELEFRVAAPSFFQVNTPQAEALLRHIRSLPALQGRPRLLDAYCGTGIIGLALARQAERVWGVECVPQAVEDARFNARSNGIHNAEFLLGRVEEWAQRLLAEGARFDAAVVDPPRRGCEPPFLAALAEWGVRDLVYVSCDPATLARDAALLDRSGFRLLSVQPVDMFPQTSHVESVAHFRRDAAGPADTGWG